MDFPGAGDEFLRCRMPAEGVIKAQTTIDGLYRPKFWAIAGLLRMTLPPVAPELAARLANYMIDDRARGVLRELAPVLNRHIGTATDEVISGARRLSQVAETYKKHSPEFRRVEIAQYQEMLPAEFGEKYLATC